MRTFQATAAMTAPTAIRAHSVTSLRSVLSATVVLALLGAGAAAPVAAFNPRDLDELRANNACIKCDLAGADLTKANLRDADLMGADLSGADLTSANLRSADLTGANLTGANLEGANLKNADLKFARMSGVVLCNTIMPDGRVRYTGCWRDWPPGTAVPPAQ